MRKTFVYACLFIVIIQLCACSIKKTNSDMLLKDYNIKNDLVVDYQMNDSVKRLLYDFFETSKESYDKYLEDKNVANFIDSVYDSFVIFDEEFQAEANINDRIELDRENNRYLSIKFVDYTIEIADILNVGFEYSKYLSSGLLGDGYSREEDFVDAMLIGINKISKYFCEKELIQ